MAFQVTISKQLKTLIETPFISEAVWYSVDAVSEAAIGLVVDEILAMDLADMS